MGLHRVGSRVLALLGHERLVVDLPVSAGCHQVHRQHYPAGLPHPRLAVAREEQLLQGQALRQMLRLSENLVQTFLMLVFMNFNVWAPMTIAMAYLTCDMGMRSLKDKIVMRYSL